MIGYVSVGTNDIAEAGRFYDALLGEMGAQRIRETDSHIVWATGPRGPAFSIFKPHDGEAATVGNGTMVALVCDTPETVDRLCRRAIELGAQDEGAAGPRGERFYAGYFRDPDGNKLNFFCLT